jgi:hypothetical protein
MGWTFVTGDTGGTGPHGGCITLPAMLHKSNVSVILPPRSRHR